MQLVSKIGAQAVGHGFDECNALVKRIGVGILEVDDRFAANLLGKSQAGFGAVDGDDVIDTRSTQHAKHHQADRAAALQKNLAVELEQTGGLAADEGMHANGGKLQQHSFLNIKAVDVEVGCAGAVNQQVIGEPAVEVMLAVVRDEAEDALLIAEVGVARMIAADSAFAALGDGGDDFIADLQRFACGIALDVLADGNNLAGAFVAENDRNVTERVALPLVNIGSADAAALDADENLIVADLGDGVFLDFNLADIGKHCDVSRLRNLGGGSLCRRSSSGVSCAVVCHLIQNLTNYVFNLDFALNSTVIIFRKSKPRSFSYHYKAKRAVNQS